MTIKEFARKYRVTARIDTDLTPIIPGRRGHIYEYSDDEMGVILMMKRPKAYTYAMRRLIAAGFEIQQNGDTEGSASFSGSNKAQADLAIREAKIRLKPHLSLEHREKLRDMAIKNLVKAAGK